MRIRLVVLSMTLCLSCVMQAAPVAANEASPEQLAQKEPPGPLTPSQPSAQQHTCGLLLGSSAPKRISGQPPIYPAIAKAKRLEGIVKLHATLDTDGNVSNISVVNATDPIFVDAAIAAVNSWKFSPYLCDGIPKAVQTDLTVNFTLSN